VPWYVAAVGIGMRWLWRHRYIFGVPIATLTALATVYAVRLPDQYTAQMTLEVKGLRESSISSLPSERNASVLQVMEVTRNRLMSQEPVESIAPLLIHDTNLTVVERLDAARKRIAYDQLGDYQFTVGITDFDPQRATVAVRTLVESFRERERQQPLTRERQTIALLDEQMTERKKDLREANEALQNYRVTNAGTLPREEQAIFTELSSYNADLTTERGREGKLADDIAKLEEQLAALDGTKPDVGGTVRTPTAAERALEGDLAETRRLLAPAQTRWDTARRKYKPGWPEYDEAKSEYERIQADAARIRRELDDVRRREEARLRSASTSSQSAKRSALETRLAGARTRLQEQEGVVRDILQKRDAAQRRLGTIASTRRGLEPLLDDVDKAEEAVVTLQRDIDDHTRLAKYYAEGSADEVTRYRVTQDAVVPVKPSGPARMRYVLSGLLLGGVLGYVFLLLRRRFLESPRVSPEHMQALLPGALIVGVPELDTKGRSVKRRFSIKEGLLAGWVLGCVFLTVVAMASYKGLIDAPVWLQKALGIGAMGGS